MIVYVDPDVSRRRALAALCLMYGIRVTTYLGLKYPLAEKGGVNVVIIAPEANTLIPNSSLYIAVALHTIGKKVIILSATTPPSYIADVPYYLRSDLKRNPGGFVHMIKQMSGR